MKKTLYVNPVIELLDAELEEGVLIVSGPGSGYNNNGNPGNDLSEDDEYNYNF